VNFDASVAETVAKVKDDKADVTWLICNYESDSKIKVQASGKGDIQEFLDALDDKQVQYGYFRMKEKFDKSVTTKFVFVVVMPQENISALKRAKYSTHKAAVQKTFQPFHFEFTIEHKKELTPESIRHHVTGVMGTRSKEVGKVEKVDEQKDMGSMKASRKGSQPEVKVAQNAKVEVENEEEYKFAMAELRNDKSGVEWILTKLNDKDTHVVYVKSGHDGLDGFLNALGEDSVYFGMLRVADKIDDSMTVKFVYVVYQPDDLSLMRKAKVGTIAGAIQDMFRPMHCDFFINKKSEISKELITDRLGSKSHVKKE